MPRIGSPRTIEDHRNNLRIAHETLLEARRQLECARFPDKLAGSYEDGFMSLHDVANYLRIKDVAQRLAGVACGDITAAIEFHRERSKDPVFEKYGEFEALIEIVFVDAVDQLVSDCIYHVADSLIDADFEDIANPNRSGFLSPYVFTPVLKRKLELEYRMNTKGSIAEKEAEAYVRAVDLCEKIGLYDHAGVDFSSKKVSISEA